MSDGLIQINGKLSEASPPSSSGRKLKTMLLFPPEWVPTAPYLALPSLTAVLRQHGHPVIQKDVNIEMYDLFFTDTFLIWVKARMSMQLHALEGKEAAGLLTEQEVDQKTVLSHKADIDVFELAEHAMEAKRITRGQDFYEADKLEWALNTFREVMQYISAAYYPASLVFYPMESNLGYRPGVSQEVFACLEDEQVNVYRDVCRQLVLPAVSKERPDVVGVSIGTQMQLMAGLTFCRMIKEAFPEIHITVGGNIITRLQEELPKQERFFTEIFDTAIMYEGEHALLWLLEALAGDRAIPSIPNLIYRDEQGVHVNPEIHTEKMVSLPLPDFDGFPLDSYFVPVRILPYLATRGCYWGRCTFCDHGQGYFDQYRGLTAQQVVQQVTALKEKYQAEHFLFADESYPPALLKKVVPLLLNQQVGIKWTTLIRFEESLQDPAFWHDVKKSGCCTLYYGMESANERVLNLMDKHVKKPVIANNLKLASEAGIWNHVMAFYGFPGETRDEAEETRQFLIDNKAHIHSVELFYFVAYRHTPMVRNPEKFGMTIHKQDEYDLPLDYYYTLNEPGGVTCLEAMQLCEEFYQNDFEPWAVRVNAREHVFLYISKTGTNRLPQIYARPDRAAVGSIDIVSGLVTWPVARGDAESSKDGEPAMARVVSHGIS
ncbi:MAG TPA: radical SAM protein [Nitrospiraceae bacterium]|nr:radical SAM protein [Nitrospiraceae bacterium]